MAILLTDSTAAGLMASVKEPNLAFEIDGVETIFGTAAIEKQVMIGDGHIVGDPELEPKAFYVGGLGEVENQSISVYLPGTSTSIKQQLDPSKGQGTSVTTLNVAFMDSGDVTRLITPGMVVSDILQRKVLVRYGFQGTNYPDDYVIVFRGFITSVSADAGVVTFQLNGVNEKQRTNIYKKSDHDLTAALNASSTAPIALDTYDNILTPIMGPLGTVDPSFKAYVRIEDEIIGFTGISSSGLTGVTRGQLGTTPAAHDVGETADTFYRLTGNAIDLALKLMASGNNLDGVAKPAYSSVPVTSLVTGGPDTVANSLYFAGVNVEETYGLVTGDVVSILGSATPANNVTTALVSDVIRGQAGDFVVIDQTLSADTSGGITANLFNQYNTLPDGCLMLPDEIDVAEHLRVQRLFLSSANYDFYLKDTIDNAREWIEKELYLPVSAYSLPRKARASLGYQIGPIPGTTIVTIDETVVKSPKSMRLQRSTNSNFFNEVVYAYDESAIEDEFESGFIAISEASKGRIKNSPNRTLTIQSKGLKTSLGAASIIQDKAKRRLDRYQFGAEEFTFSTMLDSGFAIEIGDIVNYDGRNLQLPDIRTGLKGIAPRLLEITNRDFQLKTGDLKFTAVDTNFDGNARYGLISPSSQVASSVSNQEFMIQPSFSKRFGQAEYRKWQVGMGVRVRSQDFSVMADGVIQAVSSSNLIRLKEALPFMPTAGMVLEFTSYGSLGRTMMQVQVYAWFSADNFGDGSKPYVML